MTYKAYLATVALLFMIETTSSYSINVNALGNGALIYGAEKNPSLKEYDFALTILEKHPGAKLYFYSSGNNALDPLEINLEGYDYIIAGANDLLDDCYQLEDSSTYYAAYKNPYAMKYVLFNEDIVNYSFDNSHPFYSLNTLAKNYLSGESIYNTNVLVEIWNRVLQMMQRNIMSNILASKMEITTHAIINMPIWAI